MRVCDVAPPRDGAAHEHLVGQPGQRPTRELLHREDLQPAVHGRLRRDLQAPPLEEGVGVGPADQHCHRRPVCRINVNIRMPLLVDEPVDREAIMPHHVNADKQYDSTK